MHAMQARRTNQSSFRADNSSLVRIFGHIRASLTQRKSRMPSTYNTLILTRLYHTDTYTNEAHSCDNGATCVEKEPREFHR